jgi:hypothetical protein
MEIVLIQTPIEKHEYNQAATDGQSETSDIDAGGQPILHQVPES